MNINRYCQLDVDLNAISKNVTVLKSTLPQPTRILGVLKANGYGTDALKLGQHLTRIGIDIFAVADICEAVTLRNQGFREDLLILSLLPDDIKTAIDHNCIIVISNFLMILELIKLAKHLNKKARVHLQINTGMHRFGFSPKEGLKAAQELYHMPHISFEGVMSHFSSAGLPQEDAFSAQQAQLFINFKKALAEKNIHPAWWHISNSSGAMRFHYPEMNMVRLGLGLFGTNPTEDPLLDARLTPALTMSTKIIHIQTCYVGDTISYGRLYKVEHPHMKIAVLGMGYADGLDTRLKNKGYFMIHDKKAPILGAICMDAVIVDISEISMTRLGDQAFLFGPPPLTTLKEISDTAQVIPYEILTGLGSRVVRNFDNTMTKMPLEQTELLQSV